MNIQLRPVRFEDWEMLLAWRNDPITRKSSHNEHEVGEHEHKSWLKNALGDESRKLMIAEVDGRAVGHVRAEQRGYHLLSWTVAPNERGKGIGKEMVRAMVGELSGDVRAEVRSGNDASARIAGYAGLRFERESSGVQYFVGTGKARN